MNLTEVAIITRTEFVETHSSIYCRNGTSWFSEIKNVEIKKNGCLISAVGFGKTKTQSRKNLAIELNGATLVKNAYKSNRWEVTLPNTISAKL